MPQSIKKLLFILSDIVCFVLSVSLVVAIDQFEVIASDYLFRHILLAIALLPFLISIFSIEGLYSLKTTKKSLVFLTIARSTFCVMIVSVIVLYLVGPYLKITPKTNLLISFVLFSILAFLSRKIFSYIFSTSALTNNIAVLGDEGEVSELLSIINSNPSLGFHLVQFESDLSKISFNPKIDTLVVGEKYIMSDNLSDSLFDIFNSGVNVINLVDFYESVLEKTPLNSINHRWFISSKVSISKDYYTGFKEVTDKIIAILGLMLCLPIALLLFPLLALTSGRPFFYSQIRVGLNNKEFRIYKLRSMRLDAEVGGAKWASKNDQRVTPMGAMLRTTRLDELPQLWNILNGSMSLIGPRPERPEMIIGKFDETIAYYNFRHLVKPGVTGWAQVNYGYGAGEADAKEKLQYDLFYIKNKSLLLDVRIILKTIKTVIAKIGR